MDKSSKVKNTEGVYPLFEIPYVTNNGKINNVINYISHSRDELLPTLEESAKEVGLSKRYLSTLFIKITGISYRSYIMRFRLNIVAYKLIKTGDNVDEISSSLYFSENSLPKIFKKYSGETIRHFKKEREKENIRKEDDEKINKLLGEGYSLKVKKPIKLCKKNCN